MELTNSHNSRVFTYLNKKTHTFPPSPPSLPYKSPSASSVSSIFFTRNKNGSSLSLSIKTQSSTKASSFSLLPQNPPRDHLSNRLIFPRNMISSIKPVSSSLTAIAAVRRTVSPKLRFSPLPIIRNFQNSPLRVSSPHNISTFSLASAAEKQRRDIFRVGAYEADRSKPIEIGVEAPGEQSGQKLKIGIYFATWWALNVVFNIYNKKVLNAFPYPWLTSTLSLACGSLMMLVSWVTRVAEAPKTDLDFWKTLFPVKTLAFITVFGHV